MLMVRGFRYSRYNLAFLFVGQKFCHVGTTYWALAFRRPAAIVQRFDPGVLHSALCFALHAIRFDFISHAASSLFRLFIPLPTYVPRRRTHVLADEDLLKN